MMSAQDPFYIVKEEIQDSIDKLQSAFHRWENTSSESEDYIHLSRELLVSCESLEWQVDELDKAIAVAAEDPAHYHINELELDKRRRWTVTARNQVNAVKSGIRKRKDSGAVTNASTSGMRKELMPIPNDRSHQGGRSNHHATRDDDDFIMSESDRQMLLIKQQDDELDELSASVQRIGGFGLTIHDELVGQERILEELSMDMETTSNRLDFVQKKVATVMKKAGAKGQLLMILFLVVLLIILLVLVFST